MSDELGVDVQKGRGGRLEGSVEAVTKISRGADVKVSSRTKQRREGGRRGREGARSSSKLTIQAKLQRENLRPRMNTAGTCLLRV